MVERKALRTVEVPIHYRRRLGEKKLKMKDGITILRGIIIEAALPRYTRSSPKTSVEERKASWMIPIIPTMSRNLRIAAKIITEQP